MDPDALVNEQIEAGARFLDQVDESLPVRAAFWMKAEDDGQPYLYLASDRVTDETIGDCYGDVLRAANELGDPNFDPFRVKLIHSQDPLAQDALALHRRNAGWVPTRFQGGRFGGRSVEGVYLYPPPPYGSEPQRWRGVSVQVWPEPNRQDAYYVEFWPRALMTPRGPGGQPRRVPRPAGVRVESGSVVEFRPPEKPMARLERSDYENKALEAVHELAAQA